MQVDKVSKQPRRSANESAKSTMRYATVQQVSGDKNQIEVGYHEVYYGVTDGSEHTYVDEQGGFFRGDELISGKEWIDRSRLAANGGNLSVVPLNFFECLEAQTAHRLVVGKYTAATSHYFLLLPVDPFVSPARA